MLTRKPPHSWPSVWGGGAFGSGKAESVLYRKNKGCIRICLWSVAASASVNAACFLLLRTAPALTDATILDRHAPLGAAAKVLRGQTLKHNRFVSSRAALHWHSCASRPAALPRLWCHHHTSIIKGSILVGVSSVKLKKETIAGWEGAEGGNQKRGRGSSRGEAEHLWATEGF